MNALDPYDHRRLGRRLGLFHFQEEAPGMAFWRPNGRLLYRLLEDAARRDAEAADGTAALRSREGGCRPAWEDLAARVAEACAPPAAPGGLGAGGSNSRQEAPHGK